MVKRLIILNGPPDTGKDTAADYLVEKHGYAKLEMKGAFLEFNREPKENLRIKEFGNRTWREFLIWISEEVCKPIFGDDVFALAAVKAVRDSGADFVVFSDGGFQIELDTLHKHLGDLVLVHVCRPERSFTEAKDSRRYLAPPFQNEFVILHNDSNLVVLQNDLDKLA